MAREYKPVELRPVDDGTAQPAAVVRIENRATEGLEKDSVPIRLGPAEPTGVHHRLDLPTREDSELRTYQPGIESIIELEGVAMEQLEEYWGDDSTGRNPIPWGWFALIGLTIAGAALWALTSVQDADVQAIQIRSATASALIKDAKEELAARQLIDRIHHTLTDFFNATSVEALVPVVRQAERVAPLMHRYYAARPLSLKPLQAVSLLEPLTLDNYANFWLASVVLADHSTRDVIVETTDSGAARIDWETAVCYQPMNWDDFIAHRPAGSAMEFRLNVEPDNYYNHEFGDSKRWKCFRLTATGSEQSLYGYAPAGSTAAQDIQRQIEHNGGHKTALILRLRFAPAQHSPNGVVLEKLLSPRWIYVTPPAAGP